MSVSDSELNHDPDYKTLVQAVIENAITDYIKLQHPQNRNKKYLKEGFSSAVEMFFTDDYEFKSFLSFETELPLTTKDLISIMIGSSSSSLEKTKDYMITESMKYWWEKNFHDLKIPSKIVIAGRVWFVHNSSSLKVDYNKNHIYIPIKKQFSDRLLVSAYLKVMLRESDIVITEKQEADLHKLFYLFLKVNNAFPDK